jgi:hypothetical protein
MSPALWYFSRATGLAALVLFTATVVLGTMTTSRYATAGWPRFTIAALHKNLSLLSVAFLAVHVSSVHWLTYLCWPVAVAHAFGMAQSDGNLVWVLGLDFSCVVAVLIAIAWRTMASHPDTEARKLPRTQAR